MKIKNIIKAASLALVFSLTACGQVGPQGPQGEQGVPGENGQDGKDGVTPTIEIGENGNWYINGNDTGVRATGTDGQDGKDGSDGKDGNMPDITIGSNGDWYINGKDTGVKATGTDGKDGSNGKDGNTPYVGDNGNWWIGNVDTGISAGVDDMDRVGTDGLRFELVISGGKAGYEVTGYTGSSVNVVIPNYLYGKPVISMADDVFSSSSIKSISIGNQMTDLYLGAIDSLESVDINHASVKIEDNCFKSCTNLQNIYNYENITEIHDYAFYSTKIKKFDFSNITLIGAYAFAGNSNLDTYHRTSNGLEHFIYLPSNVSKIGANAFDSSDVIYYENDIDDVDFSFQSSNYIIASYDNVCISDGYYYINNGDSTISLITYVGNEQKLSIPSKINGKTVTKLAQYSFACFHSIEWLELPNSIIEIGKYSFCACNDLVAIFIPSSVQTFGGGLMCEDFADDMAPWNYNVPYCFFESNSEIEETSVFSELFRYLTGVTTSQIAYANNALLIDKGTYYEFLRPGSNASDEYSVPSSFNGKPVTKIYSTAFFYNINLKCVNIPDSVTKLYSYAFCCCDALAVINIPASVELMNKCAVYDCSKCYVFYAGSSIPMDWDSNWYESIAGYKLGGKGAYSDGYLYTIKSNNTLILNSYTLPTDYLETNQIIEIPEKINGLTVIGVSSKCFDLSGYEFSSSDTLKIIIPSTITTFEENGIYMYSYPYSTVFTSFDSSIPSTWDSKWLCSKTSNYTSSSGYTTFHYKNEWSRINDDIYLYTTNSDKTITLNSYFSNCRPTLITVPSTILGMAVTGISSKCFDLSYITTYTSTNKLNIIVPSTIVSFESSGIYMYRYPYCNIFTYFDGSVPSTWNSQFVYSSYGYSKTSSQCSIYYLNQWQLVDGVPTVL